ncbi:hypothetical protein C8R45DRAFT_1160858 [Mycena sanguinolenta]|nr:hypothetical protein C8R45DRAFT_1160858 [Mycena sanguinolenta]
MQDVLARKKCNKPTTDSFVCVVFTLVLNGKLRRIVCIQLEEIRLLCKFPIKWVFFIANLAYGTVGRGRLYKADKGSAPLRLRRVLNTEMEEQGVDSNYYFLGPEGETTLPGLTFWSTLIVIQGEVPCYVDLSLAAMSDRASDDNWNTQTRKPRLFARAVLRDTGCVICNEDATGCEAAHIIPCVKGDSYLDKLNATRYHGAVGKKVTKIDSLRNVLLVSANVHLRMKTTAAAFLCLTAKSILQATDIPDSPGPSAIPKSLREVTKAKFKFKVVDALGQAAVDEALKEETKSTGRSTKIYIIYQHLDDHTDPGHPHNTRTRVPQDLKRRPAQYLLDFHYVSSVIQRWGSEEALGHGQPLKEAAFRQVYYDVSTGDDSGDGSNNETQVAEFVVIAEQRDENGKDRDDNGGDEDREPAEDEEESESVEDADSDNADTRPPTPACGMEPAVDFLLSWTTKKPLMEKTSIEAWANTIGRE